MPFSNNLRAVRRTTKDYSATTPKEDNPMTDIISGFKNHFQLKRGPGERVEVGRLALPAGRYSIWAKFYLGPPRPEGVASSTVKSRLQAGNDFDETIISHNRNITGASAAFNVVHSFTNAGSAVLTCEFVDATGDANIEFIRITAVNAGGLVNNPLP
jgi:hypothetical protein